jgi:23S rRNA (cytidine1920-2'-O)/16S rRNA (cytidine1409-2'-O)-methyltransferase
MKQRLDKELVRRELISTRSQAEDVIRRGFVTLNGVIVNKTGYLVDETAAISISQRVSFVSRAGEKLYSVVDSLKLNFKDKIVLDVGSSTGGFTDLALRNGAHQVIAVDVGTDQMDPRLRVDPRVELHEKTDIRDFRTSQPLDIVVIDVSFISLREILPAVGRLCQSSTLISAMVKPQFEAGQSSFKHKGVIKNDHMRRTILQDFEQWVKQSWVIIEKADSAVAGAKGNRERFYLLRCLR